MLSRTSDSPARKSEKCPDRAFILRGAKLENLFQQCFSVSVIRFLKIDAHQHKAGHFPDSLVGRAPLYGIELGSRGGQTMGGGQGSRTSQPLLQGIRVAIRWGRLG